MESAYLLKHHSMPPAYALPDSLPLAAAKNGMESDDEGPFFDLEFTVPGEGFGEEADESKEEGDDDKDLIVTASSLENRIEDLFFKPKPATSFRIFTLGPRRHKSSVPETGLLLKQSKYFVKCKIGEVPAAKPLFPGKDSAGVVSPEEKKPSNPKVKVHKYLSKIKPLYIRVSRRYAEKLRLIPIEKETAKAGEPVVKTGDKGQKAAVPARLRLACKRLGKSMSDSSVATTVSSPQGRDESLLAQQDGIQSAIAHCKRSLNAVSKETESSLQRSKSDPGEVSECCS